MRIWLTLLGLLFIGGGTARAGLTSDSTTPEEYVLIRSGGRQAVVVWKRGLTLSQAVKQLLPERARLPDRVDILRGRSSLQFSLAAIALDRRLDVRLVPGDEIFVQSIYFPGARAIP